MQTRVRRLFSWGMVFLVACVICPYLIGAAASQTQVVSDWDDGTTQGWVLNPNEGGSFQVVLTDGNPGGYVRFVDLSGTGDITCILSPG